MSAVPIPVLPPCPDCGRALELNGVDESRKPPIAVLACPSCKQNFTLKIKPS